MDDFSYLGFGLGLRVPHIESILAGPVGVDWFEIISENFMVEGGKPLYYLDQIRANYPIVMHGVSLNIGSVDPLNRQYLVKLKQLVDRVDPRWVSDHICWTGVGGVNSHDLLPLPYTEQILNFLCDRIDEVQNFLGRVLVLENPSTYIEFSSSDRPEWEFINELVKRSGCRVLLDINNIYVSSRNHGFDPYLYLSEINKKSVVQIHLAGHTDNGDYVIDTHDQPIVDPVLELYRAAVKQTGLVSTMIERDDNIPPFAVLLQELDKVRAIAVNSREGEAYVCTAE